MADHLDNSLGAAIKSLRDVVAPAVDPTDPMAQEQLALALMTLEFVRARMPYRHSRERFDLAHHVEMAERVLAEIDDTPTDLAELVVAGRAALGAEVAEETVASRSAAIAAAIAALLASGDVADERRRRVETAVLEVSQARVAVERAWYQPTGFDPDPASITPVDQVLAV